VKLVPGFTHVRRGTASYRGVLRATPRSAPSWTCKCPEPHFTAQKAAECAAAEWDRRLQGEREVLSFLNCRVCLTWSQVQDMDYRGLILACGTCGVPQDRVKAVVAERLPS